MSADIVAADQLKAIVQRVERLEGEIADLNADKSEVYKEARANGFDVKAIKKVVSKRKIEEHEREEQDHVFDIYWNAVHGLGLVHAHARENIEEFDAETGEILDGDASAKLVATVATGIQTAIGRRALVTALDIMIERETDEPRRSDSGLNIVTKHKDITAAPETAQETPKQVYGDSVEDATAAPSQPVDIPAGGDQAQKIDGSDGRYPAEIPSPEQASQSDDGAIAAVNGKAGLANADGVEPPSSGQVETPSNDDADHAAGANVGGDHVESIALRERDGTPTSNTGEGAACALPDPDRFVEDVPPTPMKRLHYAHCFPELTKAEYGRLEFSIIGIGVSRPIIRMGDVIVDGWARYNICRALGISYPIKNYSGNDVLLDVIEWQRAARNFTPAQEKKIAAELAKEIPHRAGDIMAAFGLVEALETAE